MEEKGSDSSQVYGRFRPYPSYKDSGVEWLGTIPEHWSVRRLKLLASINDEALSEGTDPQYKMIYVDIGGVDNIRGIFEREEYLFETAPSRARRIVRDGDVIISTVRTYLRAIAPIRAPERNLIVSTGFAVIRPGPKLDSQYASYALTATYFVENIVANSTGVSYPAIDASKVSFFSIVFPGLMEQQRIVKFLDRETAKIDVLIEKKERLIELLQEKRTALITQAVTKGLDPDVPMKDSGVEWLGKIPTHWNAKINKKLFKESDARSDLGDEELLTVSHISGVTRHSEKNVTMIEAESYEDYKICRQGELAINTMWAWMGALGITKEDGMVSPSYNVYLIINRSLQPRYYDYLSRIPLHVAELTKHSKGIWKSRLRLYPDGFFKIHTPIPPRDEQELIADQLDRSAHKIAALLMTIKHALENLKEYRTALISAAVTGKIDVREARVSSPAPY